MKKFEDLGLSKETLAVLAHKGFEVPTAVQEKAIPVILSGETDVVAQAQTGTGKTAAFGLPILEKLNENSKNVQALILAPTRELAIQVTEELNSLKGKKRLSIIPIYGGQSIDLQLRALRRGVDIVVGTPGRIIDHLKRRTLLVGNIDYLVLDEADEMLNMGFQEDVETIIEKTPEEKRVFLFSATMPAAIKKIATKYMGSCTSIKVTQDQLTTSKTDQIYFEVKRNDKFEALCRIIDIEEKFYGLVFCRTKIDVDEIKNHLLERGYDADALHGDISQNLREKILNRFKRGKVNILVATDVAARGIDVENLTHVINYSLPQNPEAYVHRIGRTGRAGREGNAITFVTPSEYRKLKHIQQVVKTNIRKEQLPSAKKVIAAKKERIKAQLEDLVQESDRQEYLALSEELLDSKNPQDVVAALLQYTFGDDLNEKSYVDFENKTVDMQGKTRLFIKQGKQDGFSRKKLVDLIIRISKVSEKKIRDIQILDKFSFITLPFNEAELVLAYFKKGKKKQGGMYITKAKKGRK